MGIILIILIVLIAVLVFRAAKFKAVDNGPRQPQPVSVNGSRARENLSTLVKFETVSNADFDKTDKDVFAAYRRKLKELYPAVTANSEYKELGNTAMLFKIKGKSDAQPTVLMSHYDVVPVEEDRWENPPFCGEVIDGVLWGRGTLDTKITMVGIMEAMNDLLASGFVPENDVYLSFSGDEEVAGISAPAVVDWLESQGVKPVLVLDEGGAVVDGVFPGVDKPIAVIGIGEKGMCEVEFVATSEGGHSSTPPQHTSLGKLAQTIVNLENKPFKAQVTEPVEGLFNKVGPHAPFVLRMVFANMWLFKGLICKLASKLGGEINAMMRTTTAATMAQGSKQGNVLPNVSTARVNVRLLNNVTSQQALQYFQNLCEKDVTCHFTVQQDASPYASTDSEAWRKVEKAVGDTWRDAIVSPYLMIAGSDSRHFSRICRDVYKFSAMALTKEERGLIHNDNERIPVEKIDQCVEFFHRLIVQL
ncbi:MAG: M20/M25/M40 family metallo-hydrolase [Oscillospiraceae bacterium]|nr:M20/M25/M40 family metallo-hydrolase [Oscillospiraceae bacterium]